MPLFMRRERPVQAYRWSPDGQMQLHVQRNVPGYGVPIVETEKGIRQIFPGNWVIETYNDQVMVMTHEQFIANFEPYVPEG